MSGREQNFGGVSRRTLLQAGAGLAGAAWTMPAFAVGVDGKPPIGTWPAGSEGNTVNVATRFTDVFVRRAKKWQVVASQATRLAE